MKTPTQYIESDASFSTNGEHRYSLWRIWDRSLPLVMFIGLNPSTANATSDDPTIRRVVQIAKHNGYGGVYMMNCWTYISTDPAKLKLNSLGDEWNLNLLTTTMAKCKDVVFAWGNFTIVKEKMRDELLATMFPNAKALHINKNGSPKHPLYCKATSVFIPYRTTGLALDSTKTTEG